MYIFNRQGLYAVAVCALALLFTPGLSPAAQRPGPATAKPDSPQINKELSQIAQAAIESDYAWRRLAHLTNNIGPRLSGSPQAAKAVEYVAEELRRLGLEVRLEKVTVPHWVRGVEVAELTQFPGQAPQTTQKIVLTALGGSVATPAEGLTAEVVVVNDFDQLTALGREKVAGKIVLFNERFDLRMAAQGEAEEAYSRAVIYRGGGASAAARLGAVASLIRSVGTASYRLPHTGAMFYADDAPKIPAAAVTAEDADLMAHLAAEGAIRLRLTLTPQTLPDVQSFNVVADLKGSEHPEQIVIVSGHLDSWDLGTGAIDDGAGVAVAMQTAQLLKQLRLAPKRTIRVIAWMNEENGLAGGRAYAKDHAAELPNHVAAIESDLGAGHPLGFKALASDHALAQLKHVSAALQDIGATLMRRVTDSPGIDLIPTAATGVPIFGLWQDTRAYFHYHHTAADTLDKVNPHELAENAAAMAVLAYAIANLPEPLRR